MDITAFIRELLFSHDCVIIPGFGGFIGNYTSARIDKVTSTFYPPVKQISFNRNLNNNDGLLAGRISESSKITYGEAISIIEEFVVSVRKRLGKDEKVVFDNIGSFKHNQEGNIQFEPDRNVNYLPASYGLESFHFSQLEHYDLRKRITRHIDKPQEERPAIRKILWRAAVIVPLLTLIVMLPLKTNRLEPKLETTNLNPLVTAEFENDKKLADEIIMPVPAEAEKIVAKPLDNIVQPVVPVSEEPGAAPIKETGFYLITGSFKQRENADQQVNMLKEKGFSPEIITAPNGFFRVSAIRCNSLPTAINTKDNLAKQFPGTWVRKI